MAPQDYGLIWYKGKFYYFSDYREISKGKNKGMLEVDIVLRPKAKVHPSNVHRWPEKEV